MNPVPPGVVRPHRARSITHKRFSYVISLLFIQIIHYVINIKSVLQYKIWGCESPDRVSYKNTAFHETNFRTDLRCQLKITCNIFTLPGQVSTKYLRKRRAGNVRTRLWNVNNIKKPKKPSITLEGHGLKEVKRRSEHCSTLNDSAQ